MFGNPTHRTSVCVKKGLARIGYGEKGMGLGVVGGEGCQWWLLSGSG